MKIVMTMTVKKRYYIEQMNIVTAFLYSSIEEEVYVKQLTDFTNERNRVCQLKRALYRLKQSSKT